MIIVFIVLVTKRQQFRLRFKLVKHSVKSLKLEESRSKGTNLIILANIS